MTELTIDDVKKLSPAERALLEEFVRRQPVWEPLPGPQLQAYESDADIIGYGGAAGGGKGLALTTPIATPFGWTTMGAVQVGDTVFDEAGNPCTVIAVSEVNNRPCYRLTFDDGSTLVADDVHRWVTFDAKELAALTRRDPEWRVARRAKRASRAKPTTSPARLAAIAERNARCVAPLPPPAGTIRDTLTLAATLMAGKRRNHAIRTAGALNLPNAELPVPPYTLGAWLGDGTSRNGQFTGKDAYVWERIESEGYEVRHYAWNEQAHSIIGLKAALRDLGVLENKHIPLAYLRAGYAQRLALLQGLMDTDGHVSPDGGCEFDSTNEALAVGVRQLAATLGIKSTLQRGTAKLNGRSVGPKWRVKFTTSVPVFGMPRKAERLKHVTRRTSAFRYLVACDPVESVPTRCIAVDSPSRQYLAGEQLIPTHNTDLAVGLALTQHHRSIIFRRNGTELVGVHDRIMEILGGRDGFNGQDGIWRREIGGKHRQIEYGSLPNPGDEKKYQGRPHDLIVFDEAVQMPMRPVRFLMGWLRSADPTQRKRVLLTFNPPTTVDGQWVKEFFGPWLDNKHPRPAKPGELRWYLTMPGGEEREVEGPTTVTTEDGVEVRAMSRTFFPARVTDNPYYMSSGYASVLNAMEEPFRSMMLRGDFNAGMEDDPYQVFPSEWVEIAMNRWRQPEKLARMDSVGVDVARGGKDKTVIICRHGQWYAQPIAHAGSFTPDGPKCGALVMAAARDGARLHVDGIGVGAAVVDWLRERQQPVISVNVAEAATERSQGGTFGFFNLRSQLMWKLREDLDPANNTGICLPPSRELRADLAAVKWELRGKVLQVESRDKIIEKLGRSPDYLSALMLARMDSPDLVALAEAIGGKRRVEHNPLDFDVPARNRREYNPLSL